MLLSLNLCSLPGPRARRLPLAAALLVSLGLGPGCSRMEQIGQVPDFTTPDAGRAYAAMAAPVQGARPARREGMAAASLWSGARGSLLGDRRALDRGDILTVVVEIDEGAQISNASSRARSGSDNMSIAAFLGLPESVAPKLPAGASLEPGVSTSSTSSSSGDGSVSRNEQLTLRVAATVTDVLANGVLRVEGTQEVRVNYEIRELLVSGFVRPADISRRNEITYDKIASARISYGGRGQISDVQQPRYGQQFADTILPF